MLKHLNPQGVDHVEWDIKDDRLVTIKVKSRIASLVLDWGESILSDLYKIYGRGDVVLEVKGDPMAVIRPRCCLELDYR